MKEAIIYEKIEEISGDAFNYLQPKISIFVSPARYRITITRLTPSAPKKVWRWAIGRGPDNREDTVTRHYENEMQVVSDHNDGWHIIGKIESTCKEIYEDEETGFNSSSARPGTAYTHGCIDGWERCMRLVKAECSRQTYTTALLTIFARDWQNPYRP